VCAEKRSKHPSELAIARVNLEPAALCTNDQYLNWFTTNEIFRAGRIETIYDLAARRFANIRTARIGIEQQRADMAGSLLEDRRLRLRVDESQLQYGKQNKKHSVKGGLVLRRLDGLRPNGRS
jgi:hypothetical protein